MPRYKIRLAQTVIEEARIWIEANSEDEATKLALSESRIGFADWHFAEAYGDIEVMDIQQITTEPNQ
jgi:hypothetical protein